MLEFFDENSILEIFKEFDINPDLLKLTVPDILIDLTRETAKENIHKLESDHDQDEEAEEEAEHEEEKEKEEEEEIFDQIGQEGTSETAGQNQKQQNAKSVLEPKNEKDFYLVSSWGNKAEGLKSR